ncbi:prephenate dehydratase [Alteromonas lipolytica]|uniref:Bifunctional chorismate mutase/prephenate dehydratase n=1 Tax=Alteromonas lipolytica TaxID=1856405 RepID=A0A1E8FK95_9ALTE|nr:prephenate dehydratase [Alteromonas lipolytica]OFI36038.1 chorismate mutase [Alteromonas lipolytica]GGF71470.1 bifunctional chorismate mutase/prephenate dehydratase [Alteromonas lipolytica]
MSAPELDQIRERITALDSELLALLSERRGLTNQVAETKIKHHIPVRDQAREEQLLIRLIKEGQEKGLDAHYITQVFHVIIEDSVLNQQAMLAERANPGSALPLNRVAFLGDRGSYSYLATQKYFSRRPGDLLELGCQSFREVVSKVENNEADYAVLPVENTTSGSINEVYDQLQNTELSIIGELTHAIKHSLLVAKDTNLSNIKTLYAHPQVFTQCSHFLAELGNVEVKTMDATSSAMLKVSELNRDDVAAIGSEAGGNLYGLFAIKSNLANQKENHSRFIVVAKQPVVVPLQVPAKTTFVMSTVQKPGALVEALLILKENNINMTKLESRPIPGNPWEEMFYIDVEGNTQDGPVQNAINQLKRITRYLKVLGCYPSEEINPTKVAASKALTAGN